MKDIRGHTIPNNIAGKKLKDMTEEDHQRVFATLLDKRAHCRIAYNLHNERYSIRYDGRVQCYVDEVTLAFPLFEVDEGRRQQVLLSGHKNVHAFVTGYLSKVTMPESGGVAIRYNPFESADFRTYPDDEPVNAAIMIKLYKDGKKYRMLAYSPALKEGTINVRA